MAWTRAGLHQKDRRRIGIEAARLRIEGELKDLVAAERRHERKLVALVDADRMRVASDRYHLQRLRGHAPIGAYRIDTDEGSAIAGAEQVTAAPVDRDVGK